ncbi:MAG: sialate O-acetylesterase [Akkermansiaceae bacterium]|jgi:sialate O-acetylesterase
MKPLNALILCATFLLSALPIESKIVVNPLFSDHMVLQRDMAAPIWGQANPGETVTVEYLPPEGSEIAKQKATTITNQDGEWTLTLKPLPLSAKGGRLLISGNQSDGPPTEIKDVLVGEVWLGAGQSNMAYGTRHYIEVDADLKSAIESGPYPTLKIFRNNQWQSANSESVQNFSAILFSFGHHLHRELKVPVGLMYGAVNGTPSGSWLTEEMASNSPELVKMFKKDSGFDSFEAMATDWKEKRQMFKEDVKNAEAKDRKRMRFSHPGQPLGRNYHHIEKLVPYAIRGVLWDQGESGTKIPGVDQYTVMNALITGWRNTWNRDDLPFLHVQKPSGGGCAWEQSKLVGKKVPLAWQALPEEALPEDRRCTQKLLHVKIGTIKNAPLVTTSDLTPGVHPVHKYSYGKRACRVALGSVYGRDIATCGPVYKSHAIKESLIKVSFENIGKGLAFKHGEKLQGFEIAGEDLNWQWADATIKDDTVLVSSITIKQPRHVRYAFSQSAPWANLFNKDGLPALIFTTSP